MLFLSGSGNSHLAYMVVKLAFFFLFVPPFLRLDLIVMAFTEYINEFGMHSHFLPHYSKDTIESPERRKQRGRPSRTKVK